MTTDAIRLFCDVAQQRSFSRGAELNGITQSAASQRIRALEAELGVELIDRSHRPLRLTPAGRTYYRGARRILALYERLLGQVRGEAGPLRGHVTVAAIYSAGIRLLYRAKSEFEASHPAVRVQVSYHRPEEVYERVRTERCDFGILSYPDRFRDLASIPLRDEAMVLVCRPGHRLSVLPAVGPSALEGEELAGFDAELPISREVGGYLRRNGVTPDVVGTFDNIDTIKAYLAEADAVAILPEPTVRAEVRRGVLAAVRLEPALVRPVAVVHPRGREFTPAVAALIDHLVAYEPSESADPARAASRT